MNVWKNRLNFCPGSIILWVERIQWFVLLQCSIYFLDLCEEFIERSTWLLFPFLNDSFWWSLMMLNWFRRRFLTWVSQFSLLMNCSLIGFLFDFRKLILNWNFALLNFLWMTLNNLEFVQSCYWTLLRSFQEDTILLQGIWFDLRCETLIIAFFHYEVSCKLKSIPSFKSPV